MIAAENSNEMDLIGYRVVQAQEAGSLSRLRGKILLALQRESIARGTASGCACAHGGSLWWAASHKLNVARARYLAGFCSASFFVARSDRRSPPRVALRTLDLTTRRTGRYEPKGVYYPRVEVQQPNDLHQSDFVGPCFLKGGLRFYSLNSVDLATGRCALQAVTEGKEGSTAAFWVIWHRLGFPRYQQVDNEMTFYGSATHPRGMGKLIRLSSLWSRAYLHSRERALA